MESIYNVLASRVSSFFRGLYFIRFGLILWLFPAVLVRLDRRTGAASITRGILTPETPGQAMSAAFMLFSGEIIALLIVRLVALNGYSRFKGLKEGDWLPRFAGQRKMSVALFLVAQLPGLLAMWRLAENAGRESVDMPGCAFCWLALGWVIGFLFWVLIDFIFLWSYEPPLWSQLPALFEADPPVELIFPRSWPLPASWIKALYQSSPPPLARWLAPVFRAAASVGGAGYRNPDGSLYEGHQFAMVSLAGLFVVYVFLFAFTAPVKMPIADSFCNAIAMLFLLAALAGVALRPWPQSIGLWVFKAFSMVLLGAVIAVLGRLWWTGAHEPRGFAVLGSVMVLVIAVLYTLSALAFLFDGSRVPVLMGTLLLVVTIKAVWPRDEHYFPVVLPASSAEQIAAPPEPRAILMQRIEDRARASGSPVIIVTAEGGGIHSAAWTAQVLMELEEAFRAAGAKPFHQDILMASGVSGGSAGLLSFLREYTAAGDTPFSQPEPKAVRERVVDGASCSSLQAVAWGLTYYDFLDLIAPRGLPSPVSFVRRGGQDLPSGADRSWALERAFDRNLGDPACFAGLDMKTFPAMQSGYQMTLASTAEMLRERRMPAFSFNTTAVETGGRFLLANYELPEIPPPEEAGDGAKAAGSGTVSPEKRGGRPGILENDLTPAESFLHVFGHAGSEQIENGLRRSYADLPLATAARLSASFPYVSSAARVPEEVADTGFHFVDGGYYDNDGTASAMEFLFFAVHGAGKDAGETPYQGVLPVLLIEIRNDWDMDTVDSAEGFAKQDRLSYSPVDKRWEIDSKTARSHWGPDQQLGAPPEGFWHAGHASDTRRNRRELCALELALGDHVAIHHVIFDYRNRRDQDQPLSWDLTPNDRLNIRCAIGSPADAWECGQVEGEKAAAKTTIAGLARETAEWFKGSHDGAPHEVCDAEGRSTKKQFVMSGQEEEQ